MWRLSLAAVDADGPFSLLPGVDRFIAVAAGNGMELAVGDAAPVALTIESPPFRFDGGAEVGCRLIDGPIVDLNLMLRRGSAHGSLAVHSLDVGELLTVAAGCAAVVVLAGIIGVDGAALEPADALLGDGTPVVMAATEPARVATVTISP